jgi:amidase
VIPITADQDTAGPMAKYVADVAIMFGALESAAPDPNDAATKTCQAPPNRDYTPFLKRDGLKGARIGIPRANFYDRITLSGDKEPRGGLNDTQAKAMAEAIAVLKAQGATVVDADIPSVVDQDEKNNFLRWGGACGKGPTDPNCSSVLWYGMKRDFNAWLASLGAAAPVKTLAELRDFNSKHSNRNAIKYGQANLDRSDELDLEKDRAKWEADRKKDIELAATRGIDAVLKAHKLDALVFPGASSASIAAKPGYPTVIVPFALLTPQAPQNAPYPAGFTPAPAPYGVSFTGTACSEPRLIELAYAFEQATKKRVSPPNLP